MLNPYPLTPNILILLGMQDDPDAIRRRNDASMSVKEREQVELDRKYNHYLRKARQTDLADIARLLGY